ncbi:E3 ubiquitin-protein ligase RBBP6 [Labrus bergylta]|uniref:E3 ubiquitin-protein ligase RBBP6 n=1 Tax=Labrus bergylta TaxID=56723 RepID=UPI0033135453
MSCVEKRHMSHRVGSMLHHRFPNGFTDLFMDDTDREVSTLTDRAFRSLCVGDDAVYNDEFLYGYSPFSCHKPLVGEPLKKTHHKEAKKQGQNKSEKLYTQPWNQQQQKNMSHMSSFLKAFSATEESCEGMLIKNGGMTDIKGESWDKSALRSIQRELSEFSSDYPTNLTDGHYKNCHGGPSSKTGKDVALPSGKSSKIKNGKSTVKLRKLNVKNFFLHSELSPFQTWTDFNRFPFGQEDTVLPSDSIPKWYDLPFYKELTEVHKQETQHTEEVQPCQKTALEAPPSAAPKPFPPPPPPKVLPKPSAAPAEKRCSSDGGEGNAAPWRRNKSRAKSVIPVNQSGITPQENISKQVDESLFFFKKEARSVEVKAVEEVSSLASTPFSICQLMTPLIPSRQPTETSEILQGVLSPSALDLPLRPHSEAKLTPEPPVKRESYKSLASSILFNLKDNRKRVKSRYSPPKFKTLEVPEADTQSPQSDSIKHSRAGSEGNASGLSTPAILKEGLAVCSPVLEVNSNPTVGLSKLDSDGRLSDDYLLSNLLQTKRDAAGNSSLDDNPMSPFIHSKKTKSSMAKKQNYPSLNLYKKTSPVDSEMKYCQVTPNTGAIHKDQPTETKERSPLARNKELSPKALPTNIGLSPNCSNINKDRSPLIPPNVLEKEGLSSNASVCKIPPTVPDKPKQPMKDLRETDFGLQSVISKEKDTSIQPLSTKEVIRAAREAINAAKNKALMASQSNSIDKTILDKEELKEKEVDKKVDYSKERFNYKSLVPENNNVSSQSRSDSTGDTLVQKGNVKKEPPPIPKRNFVKSDIQLALDKQQTSTFDTLTNGDSGNTKLDLPLKQNESDRKQAKLKHVFSARQNNYIKYQRYAESDDEQGKEFEAGDLKVNTRMDDDEESMPLREMRDSEHLINDLHALKELERARLGDRVHDNAKNKFGVINIDEEARAKNDLISRELRNIKKGMLSMRGNTTTKRDLFAKKEKDQSKLEAFSKTDSNVIVNKALINDNYDKAKMALEEIISERQKRNDNLKEQEGNPVLNENAGDESQVARVKQRKQSIKDTVTEAKENQMGYAHSLKETDLKKRLGDLRDHNHIRNILSQTEPGLGETYKSAGKNALQSMNNIGNEPNSLVKTKSKDVHVKQTNNLRHDSEEVNFKHLERQLSKDSEDNWMYQNDGKRVDAPPVPPRSKKGGTTRDGSITKETDSLKDFEEDIFKNEGTYENGVVHLEERATGSSKREVSSHLFTKEAVSSQIETCSDKKWQDVVQNAISNLTAATDSVVTESISPVKYPQSENASCLSSHLRENECKADNFLADMSPKKEATIESSNDRIQEIYKVKRKAPLKPDHLDTPDDSTTNHLVEAQPNKMNRTSNEIKLDSEVLSESPREIISPLLLVNGISINQSPPDHASLSSKSSYFSVESALHRNTETESNVYHSLENLIGEVEEVDEVMQHIPQNTKWDSDRTEVEYYSLSDHESEPNCVRQPIRSPKKEETEVPYMHSKEGENASSNQCSTQDEHDQIPMSPLNTFSPSLGIPALFKVKDNTFSNKLKKTVQPWSRRGSLSVSVRGEEELHQVKENPELLPTGEPAKSEIIPIQEKIFKPEEISTNISPPLLLSPSNLQTETPKKPQVGGFLTVPQEDDRFSGVSPSSEGVESFTTSTADTADEMGANDELLVECEVSKVPSERSGSTCSGNESQTGLPKPPAVLPKSEKAVLKAIKLATRRMKKEEAQKSPHKSSQGSSKQRVDRHKGEKSEHKNNSSRSKSSKSGERKHREKTEDNHNQSENHQSKNNLSEQVVHERRGHIRENYQLDKNDQNQDTRRQSHDLVESNNDNNEALPKVVAERQGRSNNRQIRDKPQRHYSSDRVISNVPVYKSQVNDRPMPERPFLRSQSNDRFLGDKLERRLSTDMSINERLDPRSQRIEKSIMDELQQRGRAREKTSRDNPLRRSHSIDAYSTEVPHPSTLSRQSSHNSHTSHTSQLSHQSSIEHAIVTQSFPMTQRKLLQDPDSGQYFFVDMPVQVKTKTFFDPETGSYVQLPVQPHEGAVPQASPLEVLTPPLVVYHGFVPVPLSPMAQKGHIQAQHLPQEEFDQRHLERSRQMLCKERHPYVEPVYGQHDHILGEFLGTEELDCPS